MDSKSGLGERIAQIVRGISQRKTQTQMSEKEIKVCKDCFFTKEI
jgi:hypothetical protein